MNAELKQRLLDMVDEDTRVRSELATTGELFEGYAPRMAQVHDRNAQELESVINQYGWPGKSLVGEEGAAAAWLILHHAIGQPAFLRRCLPILREAAAAGEAEPQHAALLEDRICFFERRPQIYGTQYDWDEHGQMSLWLIASPELVDARRQAVGLEPLSHSAAKIHQEMGVEPAPDYQQRQQEMQKWARSVGWL